MVTKKYAAFSFGIIFLFSTLILAEQPPLQRWVARYNGDANGNDYPNAMAIDNSGNIYVTGYSFGINPTNDDYATIKYGPNGTQLWVARYNGPANGIDHAYAIAVDGTGNVYVTGSSYGDYITNWDYATIKYDPNGNQLWAARYNGPASGDDGAYAIAVDSSGNVYVTGASTGDSTGYDYATIKYDHNGNQLWAERYDFANGNDYAYALAVDNSGNVYVTGESGGSGSGQDYATIKYGPNGTKLWEARYSGAGNYYDSAKALAVDNSGNVYVTGSSYASSSRYDYATIKYNPNGTQSWVKRYNGPANQTDEAQALALDNSGNIYVTGSSDGSGTSSDYATIGYDPNGSQLWITRYNGPGNGDDNAQALVVDNFSNVYVAGYSLGSTANTDYSAIKYDHNGNQLWVTRYNGPANGADNAFGIKADNSGNVYVTGYSVGNGTGNDYTTIKYTQRNYCTAAPAGDVNGNCKVDFIDYAALAKNWLIGKNWNDLATLANNWLECNFALAGDCWQ